jgi:hypothetical protein
MNMPGFTADSACYSSRGQYRLGPSFWGPAKAVIPQWGAGPCIDWQCLSYCEEGNPYNVAICYEVCKIPCHPYQPDEMLPPG